MRTLRHHRALRDVRRGGDARAYPAPHLWRRRSQGRCGAFRYDGAERAGTEPQDGSDLGRAQWAVCGADAGILSGASREDGVSGSSARFAKIRAGATLVALSLCKVTVRPPPVTFERRGEVREWLKRAASKA